MDVPQLKLLAGRIRDLLAQANVTVTYNQGLELSAALVGLRNWPEVQAFPQRLAATKLDLGGAGRLAHRLQRKHGLDLSAEELLDVLRSGASETADELPQIWPTGPRPGVYITMEQANIDALLAAYDEATDGALVYAEDAGQGWKTAINLGEHGLWSAGMEAVPSGTLVVLGPMDLNQQSWEDAGSRIESACLKALTNGHRFAVLLDTATPETLFHDVELLVRARGPEGDDTHEALVGVVTERGELAERRPFVEPLPEPVHYVSEVSVDAIPGHALPLLHKALAQRSTGLLLFGSSVLTEHRAIALVTAALGLTDFAGPAARIRPRSRSTPAKDWDVPEAIKQLPFLPSIESAYALGYRRMVVDPNYVEDELLDAYADEVLFIGGTYGSSVDDVFFSGMRGRRYEHPDKALNQHVAILAVTSLKAGKVQTELADMYVPDGRTALGPEPFEEAMAMLRERRCLKAEEQLEQLLQTGQLSTAALKKALTRNRWAEAYLKQRKQAHAVSAA